MTDEEVRAILRDARTIAVVGASDKPTRASNGVADYLLRNTDYDLWLVNPRLTELFGQPVYPDLASLPGAPDIVDVFRRSSELSQVAGEAVAAQAKVLWLQLGLSDESVATTARSAGLQVVMDRCLRVEHQRLM